VVTLDVTDSRRAPVDLEGKTLLDLLCGTGPQVSGGGTVEVRLGAYDFRWLRIPDPADHRLP
jgi:hypothetical protein